MKRNALVALIGSVIVGSLCSAAFAAERVSAVEKGSFLVFPKVEIKWTATPVFPPTVPPTYNYAVSQDTFIDLTNDYPQGVFVQMQFVNGDGYTPASTGACTLRTSGETLCEDGPREDCPCSYDDECWEREHLSNCRGVDVTIHLTQNEPTYWSAVSGGNDQGGRVSPFTILDPGAIPGRPDPDSCGANRILRGFIVAWAVDATGQQIGWNHLKGDALIVDYASQSAWEYNAYAYQVHSVDRGDLVHAAADETEIVMDGVMYDYNFATLLLDFYAEGSTPFNQGLHVLSGTMTDLTLLPMDIDLTQDGDNGTVTKVVFQVWNENEVGFSGAERCIRCWNQDWLNDWAAVQSFDVHTLQTDKGKAHIDGKASVICEIDDKASQNTPLVGVAMKRLDFTSGAAGTAKAGMNLVGMGVETAVLLADIHTGGPEEATAPEPRTVKTGTRAIRATGR